MSAQPRRQPPQQPPPVQRVRLRYAKRGRLRFASHRDFSRAFERALVRAGTPTAYSSGFNPHPRISYAGAAPTGAASEAEYLEVGLASPCEPEDLRRRLDEVLPEGLDIVEAVTAGPGSLADRLEASRWEVRLPQVDAGEAGAWVAAFLALPEVSVERMTKKGLRRFDCRAAVLRLSVRDDATVVRGDGPQPGECAILDLVLRHGTPSVRPDDVLAALREVSQDAFAAVAVTRRLAQGPWDAESGTVGDPLAPDRDASRLEGDSSGSAAR